MVRVPGRRSFARPIVLAALCLLAAAIVVQTTRTGVDLLALLAAGFVLLVVERTLGDWVAEAVGPLATAVIFAAVAVAGVAYIQTAPGGAPPPRLFAAAEARGYHTAYFTIDDGQARGAAADAVRARLERASHATASAGGAGAAPDPVPVPGPTPTAGATSGSPARGVRIARLRLDQSVTVTGREVAIFADVTAEKPGMLPQVEFSLDGRTIAIVSVVDGVAATRWTTRVPGQYVVRARLAGGFFGGVGPSATLSVLPARR